MASFRTATYSLLVLAAGCGRLGFDVVDAGADATFDAPFDADLDATYDGSIDFGTFDAGPPVGPCVAMPRLPTAPVIDGVLEPGLTLVDVPPVKWEPAQTAPMPADHSARYAVAWRPDGIYFYVEVTDPTLQPPLTRQDDYCGDGVELYVDDDGRFTTPMMYDAMGTRQFIITSPATATTPAMRASIYRQGTLLGNWTSSRFGAFPRTGGYAVEALVVAADLGLATWSPSGQVGFDLAFNVSGMVSSPRCSWRLGQYFLRALPGPPCTGDPFCETTPFCLPTLSP